MKSLCRLGVGVWLALAAQGAAQAVQTAVLSWSPSSNTSVAGYKIYYGSSSHSYANVINVGNTTNATISGLADGSTNYFAATTYDSANAESALSEEITVVTKKAVVVVPDPPVVVVPQLGVVQNLVAVTNANDPHSLTLSWDADTNSIVAGYRIYWGTNSDLYYKTFHVGQISSLVFTGLVENTTHYFMIRERDAEWNEGPISSEASCFLSPVASLGNVPPTLDPLANLTINMNANTQTVVLTGISCGSAAEGQVVKVSAVSSNSKLIAVKAINYLNPNSSGTLAFKPAANATGTATITVTVNDGGKDNNSQTQTFTVTVVNQAALAAMPKITRQLGNSVALSGKQVSLSVGVSGKAPFKYQWKLNGTNIAGATSATLTLKQVKAKHAGRYSVQVSNGSGATNSQPAVLSVVTNPAPTLKMSASSVPQSTSPVAKFAVEGTSNPAFGVQIDGVTGARYVVQGSSDLKTWTTLTTNTAPFYYSEANAASFQQRYYRSYYLP